MCLVHGWSLKSLTSSSVPEFLKNFQVYIGQHISNVKHALPQLLMSSMRGIMSLRAMDFVESAICDCNLEAHMMGQAE